jgi:hypothetical protein
MRNSSLLIAIMMLSPACLVAPPDEEVGAVAQKYSSDGGPNGDTGATVCRTLTIRGKVFYNDLRSLGRWGLRMTPTGGTGARSSWDPAGTNENYLGLLDGQIDLYEVDNVTGVFTDPDCQSTAWLGSTSIAADGSWEWVGQVCDSCNVDFEGGYEDTSLSVAAKVSLRKCDHPEGRCFSLRDPNGAPTYHVDHYADGWDGPVWARFLRSATVAAPRLTAGGIVDLGNDYFQASGSQTAGVVTDLEAQAASVFASLVDVTRKVHLTEDIPFDYARHGEIKGFFPDASTSTHSHQAERLCVEAPEANSATPRTPTEWYLGYSAAHEYGHLTHYWQWENSGKWTDLCFQETAPAGDLCDHGGDPADPQGEFALDAFKEGWADFVAAVTFEDTGSRPSGTCDDPDYTPVGCTGGVPCTLARHFEADVKHSLCNLRTVRGDQTIIPMFGLHVTMLDLWNNLGTVWWNASLTTRNDVKSRTWFDPGSHVALGICEFAEKLSDPATVTAIEDKLALTNLECNL